MCPGTKRTSTGVPHKGGAAKHKRCTTSENSFKSKILTAADYPVFPVGLKLLTMVELKFYVTGIQRGILVI